MDTAGLQETADKYRSEYCSAEPFPHIVIDDFFAAEFLTEILAEHKDFNRNVSGTKQYATATERKLTSRNEDHFGIRTLQLVRFLNSGVFLRFLEQVTGIKSLIADPHFVGGGLHTTHRGGFLKIHADFNKHPEFGLDRRLNLLVYLNNDWEEKWGGHFELWNPEMTRCAKKVLPVFNRVVIFSTTSTSFHGQPDPLTCPDSHARRSIALYYYTNGRPADEVRTHHNTLFRQRDINDYGPGLRRATDSCKSLIRDMTPPVIWNVSKQMFGRRP